MLDGKALSMLMTRGRIVANPVVFSKSAQALIQAFTQGDLDAELLITPC